MRMQQQQCVCTKGQQLQMQRNDDETVPQQTSSTFTSSIHISYVVLQVAAQLVQS
jgi:hypothetical protein